jgi:hypothetical protein
MFIGLLLGDNSINKRFTVKDQNNDYFQLKVNSYSYNFMMIKMKIVTEFRKSTFERFIYDITQ